MKEMHRINPAVPIDLPHRATKSAVYRGMSIPEGTMVIANIWQMMMDESYFPRPDTFLPDRFLGKEHRQGNKVSSEDGEGEGTSGHSADNPSEIVFGFGRRVCPGRFFAEASLWLAIANVLAVFDILPELDGASTAQTEGISAEMFTSGVTSRPKPFKCRIVPRSAKHASLIGAASGLRGK